MAVDSPLIRDGSQTTAAADLSSSQFLAVKVTASRQVNLANTGGEGIYGILQNKPQQGDAADIGILGVSKAIGGAAFSAGAELMTDSSGRLVLATSANRRVAMALEDCGVANQVVSVALVPGFGVTA